MNVLMVDQFGEIGGAQKCLLDLLGDWTRDDGLIVAAPNQGTLLDHARTLGFQTTSIPCGTYALGHKTGSDVLRFCRDVFRQRAILRRIIREQSIGVVYVNGPRVLAGAALAARGRCPLVFHAHNHLAHRYEAAVVRWANAGTVITCCEYVARPLRKSGIRNVRVIPNGVPDARFRRRHYPPDGAWKLGIAGRISPEKGHGELIEAVRVLSAEGHRIELTVAGSSRFDDGTYESWVRAKAADLNVRFTGWVDDVSDMLAGLDVLAVPSTAEAGLPRVVLEAFSAGVPVIALPTGGIAEAVHNNETGFLAPDASPGALTARLRTVFLTPPSQLDQILRNARAAWESHWNADRWRRDVTAVLRAASDRTSEAPQAASERTRGHGVSDGI